MNIEREERDSGNAYATTQGLFTTNTSLELAISMPGMRAELNCVAAIWIQSVCNVS